MKKFTLLAILCALFGGQYATAQEATTEKAGEKSREVTYVEDPSQGYLFNKLKDNWFVTGEVGAGFYMSPNDSERNFLDRFSPAASIYIGKWFSPSLGARLGINWLQTKGLSSTPYSGGGLEMEKQPINGSFYRQKFSEIGPVFDLMLNVTNALFGYEPKRPYNLVAYLGGGGYWTYAKVYDEISTAEGGTYYDKDGWKFTHDRVITFRAGIINSYNVSDQVQLSLDLRYSGIDNHKDEPGEGWNKTAHDIQAYVGVTYLFNKREWNAPIVPVCPEPEELRVRLQTADARVADLEQCIEEPEQKAPLATIYYPKNVFKITKKDVKLLTAVAEVMKNNPSKVYLLTGWADNYTGNTNINTRLRNNRVDGVKKQLVKLGVPEYQLRSTINHTNLVDLGEKYQALGRAVTIEEL